MEAEAKDIKRRQQIKMVSKNKQTQDERISTCDGQSLKRLTQAGLAWLEQNYKHVDSLNVFPVPDGDTGTNMLLTMRSAFREIVDSEETHAGQMAQKIYNGALMGARGNSGVILSQLWRGFARGVENQAQLDPTTVAQGFEEASRMAYQAVQEPVEGTMLTVAREATEEALKALEEGVNLESMLERVVARSHLSVERTPELLDVLREAGVVDAGGMGLACILEGMLRHIKGESLEVMAIEDHPSALQSALMPEDELGYGYDVQFLLKGQKLNVNQVRADIDAMGDSTLVVGDENLIKVHVHVHNPGIPLSYGAEKGTLLDVIVENMQEQYQEFVGEHGSLPQPVKLPEIVAGHIAAVAVAPGDGLSNIFYSLGAGKVIAGGQTMNPSTEEIVQAICSLPTDKIAILPNNKNIFLAAAQAAELVADKQVRVIPSKTIPQGIAALLALDPEGEFEPAMETMEAALQMVETGEVTTSTRKVTLNGVNVKKGQIIGLHNDNLAVAGDDINTVVVELLEEMGAQDLELIALYYGKDVEPRDAHVLVEHLQETYPDHEIELREGGQPHYFYILSAE